MNMTLPNVKTKVIAALLGVILLGGCNPIERYAEYRLMTRGPERIQILTDRIKAEPLKKRYEYLASEDFETSLAAVWSFWNDQPVNDEAAIHNLIANLPRWRHPASQKMIRSMKKSHRNYQSLLASTVHSLRYICEFTKTKHVAAAAEAGYESLSKTAISQKEREYIRFRWTRIGERIEEEYRNKPKPSPSEGADRGRKGENPKRTY